MQYFLHCNMGSSYKKVIEGLDDSTLINIFLFNLKVPIAFHQNVTFHSYGYLYRRLGQFLHAHPN